MEEEYLQHHGILGMKWGIRRYQNPDGTLTAEGKQRYRTDEKFKQKYDDQAERIGDKARDIMNKKKLPEINKKWEDIDLTKDDKALKKYDKEVFDTYNKTISDLYKSESSKKALKIGAAVAGTALAAAGGYYLYKTGKLDSLINKGREVFSGQDKKYETKVYKTDAKLNSELLKTNISRAKKPSTNWMMKAQANPNIRNQAKRLQDMFTEQQQALIRDYEKGKINNKELRERTSDILDAQELAAKRLIRAMGNSHGGILR